MAAGAPLICDAAAAQAASTKTHDAMAVLKAPLRAIVRETRGNIDNPRSAEMKQKGGQGERQSCDGCRVMGWKKDTSAPIGVGAKTQRPWRCRSLNQRARLHGEVVRVYANYSFIEAL